MNPYGVLFVSQARGHCDANGYFVEPALIQVADANARTMREEIFGPVLSIFVYPDKDWEEIILCVGCLHGRFWVPDREYGYPHMS
ncbi:aldehyde dehydrogenase family protein [Allopusillimonas ginsengisoli]|uniref:aldehyde dehydrogenase family protein n=1 Tax=Allopusillimonas ginsengisoli TaxID=453575 RepID=UPI0010C1638B|nr:aldehyde dehydrogenase family protein [Allopusillimonas ginsengisoli]